MQDKGDRDEVLRQCNTNKELDRQFSEGCHWLQLAVRPFCSADVTRNLRCGVRALCFKRGLTPDQFKEHFKEGHEKSGRTVQNLLDPSDPEKHYAGILVDDAPILREKNIGILYEFFVVKDNDKCEYKLHHADQMRGDQADAVFAKLVGASQLELGECKIMRTSTDTVEKIWTDINRRKENEKNEEEAEDERILRAKAEARQVCKNDYGAVSDEEQMEEGPDEDSDNDVSEVLLIEPKYGFYYKDTFIRISFNTC